ncbi:Methyl halide transferase [Purpureocillium takamizusanense]|uniref:Methyl halide transferase n=1 Tax=Purpureocillium takamizusanense TaxID=2060973 RepID=A0A9Q8QKC2_9HYPO|nr:Methyl halide transferase [Purpureocillium takamizusanense]UNI20756.1 Methyl halide transferase [Purpureocillium takamizusanense]
MAAASTQNSVSSSAPAITPEERSRLQQSFASLPFTSHPSQWDSLYRQAFTPWDRAGPSLALADLLAQRTDLVPPAQERDARGNLIQGVPRRTALVPGCGRGHDVLLLSSFGYDVWGLDYSPDAVRMAEENRKDAESKGLYKPVEQDLEKGDVKWLAGDFFDGSWSKGIGTDGSGTFDLIYDYTFLCALPPEARPRWAKRMADLVHPKGRLVCLEFPTGKPLSEPGPPWGLNPEVYEALLSAPGEEVSYNTDGTVVHKPSSKPCQGELHRLSIIKPSRTHPAGTSEDGSVLDFISVWTR